MSAVPLAARLDGVVAVLATAYRGTQVQGSAITGLAARLDRAGIHVLTALGNTAEIFQLDHAERLLVLRGVIAGRDRAVAVAGAAGAIKDVMSSITEATAMGYDAAMVHEPVDPFGGGEGVEAYFSSIADASSLPVIPYVRSTRLTTASLRAIANHPNVIGMKFARSDTDVLQVLIQDGVENTCTWINGCAESQVPMMTRLGVRAFTSGIANAMPDLAMAIHGAATSGDNESLEELVELVAPIERIRAVDNGKYNIAVIKQLLAWFGSDFGTVRAPHSPLPVPVVEKLRSAAAGGFRFCAENARHQ